MYRSMKLADINGIGIVNEDVFCSWCASSDDLAQRVASSLMRTYNEKMASTVWQRLFVGTEPSQTLPTAELDGLTNILSETNVKLKRKDVELLMEELDSAGNVDVGKFNDWLAMDSVLL